MFFSHNQLQTVAHRLIDPRLASSLQGPRGLPARPVIERSPPAKWETGLPCNEEKERKGKIEDPSGRDFSAKKKQGEVVVTLGLTW